MNLRFEMGRRLKGWSATERKCKSFERNRFELETVFANSQKELVTDLSSKRIFVT